MLVGPEDIYDGKVAESMDIGDSTTADVEVQQSSEKRSGHKARSNKLL
jgi:hypothetical protein